MIRIATFALFATAVLWIGALFQTPAWGAEMDPGMDSVAVSSLIPMEKEDKYQAFTQQAVRAFEEEQFEESLEHLNQAQELYPKDAFLWNLRGAVYTKQKEFEKAREAFQESLSTDPRYFPARFNLGEVYFLEGNTEEALRYFQALSDNFWRNELLEFKLVILYSLTGKEDDARRILTRMQFPGDTPAWYYANAAFAKHQGQNSESRKYLRAARNLFSDEKTALYEESLVEAKLLP